MHGAIAFIKKCLLRLLPAFFLYFFVLVIFSGFPQNNARANSAAFQERDEVFFSFRYRGVGDVVVIAMFEEGQIYLPVTELFEFLGIVYRVDAQQLRVSGHFIEPGREYLMDFRNQKLTFEEVTFELQSEDFLLDELDFYLKPEIFRSVFGMDFMIDMSGLVLRMESAESMPVEQRLDRQQHRARADLGVRMLQLHPLEYERKQRVLGGGFFDYSLTGNFSDQMNTYTFSGAVGMEVLGGDLQGNMFANWSEATSNFTTSGLRWRYVFFDQPALSQVYIGQHRTEGPQSRSFTGIHLTNQPIEPRRLLDEYIFRGTAPAESEVELYLNNRLVDYQVVDELGNYQFNIPLTYGSSQVRIMVYEPDGRVREEDRRIQIPFTFLPPGEFNYHLSGGRMDNPITGMDDYSEIMSLDAAYGISNRVTARVGAEYLSEEHDYLPFFYGGLSARIFEQYLVNVDLAPEAYYRLSTSVIYPNSISWDLNYTYFVAGDGIYNLGRNDYEIRGNLFVPVQIGNFPVNFRISADRQEFGSNSTNRVRGDVGFRINRLTLRGGYRDTYRFAGSEFISSDGRLTSAASYTIPRRRSLPRALRGIHLRGQADYSLRLDQMERVDIQLSRSFLGSGRLRASWGHNFIGGFNIIEGALTFDFNRTRSTSTARYSRNSGTFRQSFRGSVGFDDYHNRVILDNRQQVGRSAASVRMFVDRNNSGMFDEGDELIQVTALRLNRSGNIRLHGDGIVRVTQLQQYYQDNMEVNVAAIPNPLLVPVVREFSFVADPNRFKPMDIPFYMSGVLDGMVMQQRAGTVQGLGGVRVMLRQMDGDHEETIRTFSDGSYYAMEIPPGYYEAWVDSTQQNFLGMVSDPAVRRFEVRALAEGDFLEDMNFTLVSPRIEEAEPEEIEDEQEEIETIIAERGRKAIRIFVEAQRAFYMRDFERS
ncbi:hypothetical protein QLX67_07875, partial [Balneolaceae bacterium ANBcel3]|nr:hypothetical protein [Balneolaceae bacterium ANBcel3]